jgi:hypothetical protein
LVLKIESISRAMVGHGQKSDFNLQGSLANLTKRFTSYLLRIETSTRCRLLQGNDLRPQRGAQLLRLLGRQLIVIEACLPDVDARLRASLETQDSSGRANQAMTLRMETLEAFEMTAVEDMVVVMDEEETRTAIDLAAIEMIEIVSESHIAATLLENSANGIVKTIGGRTDQDRRRRRFRAGLTENPPRTGSCHHRSLLRRSALPPS